MMRPAISLAAAAVAAVTACRSRRRLVSRRLAERFEDELHGGTNVEQQGLPAPDSGYLSGRYLHGLRPAFCGACGLLTTTPKALRFHRTRDGRCLDPMTDLTPRHRDHLILAPAYQLRDGRIVWGRSRLPLLGRTPAEVVADHLARRGYQL